MRVAGESITWCLLAGVRQRGSTKIRLTEKRVLKGGVGRKRVNFFTKVVIAHVSKEEGEHGRRPPLGGV